MVNTNKIIAYLTHKPRALDKRAWSHQAQMQDALDLVPLGAGLGDKEVEQPEKSVTGVVKDVCSGLQAKAAELDFVMPCSENFMLGASVTSFYMPPRF